MGKKRLRADAGAQHIAGSAADEGIQHARLNPNTLHTQKVKWAVNACGLDLDVSLPNLRKEGRKKTRAVIMALS